MALVHVALGGNVGDVESTFERTIQRLDELGLAVEARSSTYITPAVGPNTDSQFYNSVVGLRTSREPLDVLRTLQSIEDELNRTRELRWGPRTIDLDVLFYEQRVVNSAALTVPHPACWYRRFVLDPLAEIAGQLEHPVRLVTVAELRDRLLVRPLRVAVVGGARRDACVELIEQFNGVRVVDWSTRADGEPVLTIWVGGDDTEFENLPHNSRIAANSGDFTPEQFAVAAVSAALGPTVVSTNRDEKKRRGRDSNPRYP